VCPAEAKPIADVSEFSAFFIILFQNFMDPAKTI